MKSISDSDFSVHINYYKAILSSSYLHGELLTDILVTAFIIASTSRTSNKLPHTESNLLLLCPKLFKNKEGTLFNIMSEQPVRFHTHLDEFKGQPWNWKMWVQCRGLIPLQPNKGKHTVKILYIKFKLCNKKHKVAA